MPFLPRYFTSPFPQHALGHDPVQKAGPKREKGCIASLTTVMRVVHLGRQTWKHCWRGLKHAFTVHQCQQRSWKEALAWRWPTVRTPGVETGSRHPDSLSVQSNSPKKKRGRWDVTEKPGVPVPETLAGSNLEASLPLCSKQRRKLGWTIE